MSDSSRPSILSSPPVEGAIDTKTVHDQLNKLVIDLTESGDLDLERLEDGLRQFNIFEALGAISAEIRHSNLLAWLLDPNESHGLGDIVVKRFLRHAMTESSDGLSAIALDLMNLSDLEVRREWANIDICLISDSNRLIVVIENKIESAESNNQLRRYRERVECDFPTSAERPWTRFFLFLTVDGDDPTDDAYIAVSYRLIVQLLEAILKNRRPSMLPDVATLIEHYVRMMRSHHMDESDLIQLARKIYAKHRAAFGFIFNHRPDAWSDTKSAVLAQLRTNTSFEIDSSTERSVDVRLLPSAWSPWRDSLSKGVGWKTAGSNAFMLCKLSPNKDRNKAQLQLMLGPGPAELREKLVQALRLADVYRGNPSPKWTLVLRKPWRVLVNDDESEAFDPQEGARQLRQDIDDFASHEVPKIKEALSRVLGDVQTTLIE